MKRRAISGKTIVGIDPAGEKHQASVIDQYGYLQGKSFTFGESHYGYHKQLWRKLEKQNININPSNTVFAIECACNFWQNLAFYLHSEGYEVVLVSPLKTHKSRALLDNSFSKTDPKDAILVAENASKGFFTTYLNYDPDIKTQHNLAITYGKLKKELNRNRLRMRAFMKLVFPEFVGILNLETKTAQYLLSKYFLPEHYLDLNIFKERREIERISRKKHGAGTLNKLKEAAASSIGVPVKSEDEMISLRLTLDSWLHFHQLAEEQMDQVMTKLIQMAQKTPVFNILVSIKGISAITASLFIAETRALSEFDHYKKIEKYAGYNLRISDSGKYSGRKRMSKIGNKRLSTLIYLMTTEAVKYIPEVRIKYLKRQLRRRCYRKSVIACAPILLRMIVSLVKQGRTYQESKEKLALLEPLEAEYAKLKKRDEKIYRKAI